MKPTDQALFQQLRFTDREIERRLQYLHITPETRQTMLRAKPHIASEIETIVREFYKHLVTYDEIAAIIGDAESLARLRRHLRRYVLELFDGRYDMEYVQTRLRIGLVHKRIGVPPKHYIMAMNRLQKLLRICLTDSSDKDCDICAERVGAVEKVLLFDLTLVIDTYIHSLLSELDMRKKDLETYAAGLEEKVAERTRELERVARIDGLTGLYNHRSFQEALRREVSRSRRRGTPLSLLYIDLDGFKEVNDTQGHQEGDRILAATSEVIREVVRTEDFAARYGGDEFCVLLPHTGRDMAREVAGRLITAFEDKLCASGVSLSIGVAATGPELLLDAETLLERADMAMYEAKKIAGHLVKEDEGTPVDKNDA